MDSVDDVHFSHYYHSYDNRSYDYYSYDYHSYGNHSYDDYDYDTDYPYHHSLDDIHFICTDDDQSADYPDHGYVRGRTILEAVVEA